MIGRVGIISNYIFDIQQMDPPVKSSFQCFKTMAGFVTFGCNIPIFMFAFEPEDVTPIKFPGTDLLDPQRKKPWWYNYYDRDDVLGYPLAQTSPKYEELSKNKDLRDVPINVGGLISSWNPLSHKAYWQDPDFYKPVSNLIRSFL